MPVMQFPIQMLPTMYGGYTGVPYSASQPLMALPSTQSNQAVTRLPQGQTWHPGMNHTQTAPKINGTYHGVTSLPYTVSQPLMALPSTERYQNATLLSQSQMWHPGMTFTQPASSIQNLVSKTSSIAQLADIPPYQVASTSRPPQSIPAAIHQPTEDRALQTAPLSLTYTGHEESKPTSKRTKHESGSDYRPDELNVRNPAVTEFSEYKLNVITNCI